MKAIVTGGAGFIGSNLVDQLIEDGHDVYVFDDLSSGKRENINESAWFERLVDISDWDHTSYNPGDIIKAEGIDTIFHLAARARVQPSIENPIEFNNVNVNGTLNLLKAAVDNGVKRFVYSSSSSIYGNPDCLPIPEQHPTNPLSPYGAQKLIGEIYTKTFSKVYGLETVNLRYFNVYGERQTTEGAYCLVMGMFIQQRLNGEPMTIRGTGTQRRDFTYVGDAVRANILAATSDKVGNGESINIGNGDNRSVNDIANMIGGDRINVIPVLEPEETMADNRLALGLLGWEPTGNIEEWVENYKKEIGL